VEIVNRDLKDGQHRNRTKHPDYFTDAFFHHPDELRAELAQAGFRVDGIYGVEGPCWMVPEVESWWNDKQHRETLLKIARAVETEPSLLGVSSHMIAVGRKAR
jgi:hypothetical protein